MHAVHAVGDGIVEKVLEAYELIGIGPLDVPGESAGAVARIRADTRVRMPDALAIYSCEREGAELVTTDRALERAATRRWVRTHLLALGE